MYFAPWDANFVGVFDPSTHAFSTIDISAFGTVGNKYG